MADDALGGEDAGADLDVGLRIRTAGWELGSESSSPTASSPISTDAGNEPIWPSRVPSFTASC
jgi:hypothetical protein